MRKLEHENNTNWWHDQDFESRARARTMAARQAELEDVELDGIFTAKNGKTYRRVNGGNCDKCAGGKVNARGKVDWRLCGELPECQAVVHGEFVFMVWVEVE